MSRFAPRIAELTRTAAGRKLLPKRFARGYPRSRRSAVRLAGMAGQKAGVLGSGSAGARFGQKTREQLIGENSAVQGSAVVERALLVAPPSL